MGENQFNYIVRCNNCSFARFFQLTYQGMELTRYSSSNDRELRDLRDAHDTIHRLEAKGLVGMNERNPELATYRDMVVKAVNEAMRADEHFESNKASWKKLLDKLMFFKKEVPLSPFYEGPIAPLEPTYKYEQDLAWEKQKYKYYADPQLLASDLMKGIVL